MKSFLSPVSRGGVVAGVCGVMLAVALPLTGVGMSPATAATPAPVPPAPVNVNVKPPAPAMVKGGQVLRIPTGLANSVVGGTFTAVSAGGGGFLSAYACDGARPATSTVNFGANDVAGNYTMIPVGPSGDVCVYTNVDTHVIMDLFESPTPGPTLTAPVRKVDTRTATKPGVDAVVKVQTGKPGQRVYGNITVTEPSIAGYATVYTNGTARPATSTINYAVGETVANFTSAVADKDGFIAIYTLRPTHLIFDQIGSAPTTSTTPPTRVLDTRNDGARPAAGSEVKVKAGPPNSQVWANITMTDTAAGGYVTAYTPGATKPFVASASAKRAGDTRATYVTAVTDKDGNIALYTSIPAHLIVDVYATGPVTGKRDIPARGTTYTPAPERVYDTRELGGGYGATAISPAYEWRDTSMFLSYLSGLNQSSRIPAITTIPGTVPARVYSPPIPGKSYSYFGLSPDAVYTATGFPASDTGRPMPPMYTTGKTSRQFIATATPLTTTSKFFLNDVDRTGTNAVLVENQNSGCSVVVKNLKTGAEKVVYNTSTARALIFGAKISPDGTKVTFVVSTLYASTGTVYLSDVTTGTTIPLYTHSPRPQFADNGTRIIMNTTISDQDALVSYHIATNTLTVLAYGATVDDRGLNLAVVSADGQWVFFGYDNVSKVRVTGGPVIPVYNNVPKNTDTGTSQYNYYQPWHMLADGVRIVFSDNGSGKIVVHNTATGIAKTHQIPESNMYNREWGSQRDFSGITASSKSSRFLYTGRWQFFDTSTGQFGQMYSNLPGRTPSDIGYRVIYGADGNVYTTMYNGTNYTIVKLTLP